MLSSIILKIKRRENAFYSLLYAVAKYVRSFNVPVIKVIHLPLYYLDYSLRVAVPRLIQICWSIPLFKARCNEVGKNLMLPNGIPLVIGSHLNIYLGNDVTIMRSTLEASKVFDPPELRIGDKSGIGYGTTLSIAKEIVIGDNTMIGPNCLIMDNDDHPINPVKRLNREPVSPNDVHPVKIGNNVWIAANCAILKGVTIGDNSIIAAHSVITKNVLPNCIYAGYPARPTVKDLDKIGESSND